MTLQNPAEMADEQTYTYREYLEKFSRPSPDADENHHGVEEDDPEKVGEALGKRIIERLITKQ